MKTENIKPNVEAEFSKAYREYSKELCTHAFFKVNNRLVSEDLVQDTFIKVWNYLTKGGEVAKMRAFLHHILNNLIIDYYRKHKSISLDDLLQNGYEPSEDNSERMVEVMDGKAIVPMVKSLPEKYQKVVSMRFMEELTLEEISKITHESKNTIAVRVHRGLEKLKVMYAPYANA